MPYAKHRHTHRRHGAVAALLVLLSGCAQRKTVTVVAVPDTTSRGVGVEDRGSQNQAATNWRVDTREHVDLWLHGFAMLQNDASLVPYFRLGYRASLASVRATGASQLDANRQQLQQRVTENLNLVSAQFLALYFASWDDMRQGVARFLGDGGEIRAARNNEEVRMYATLRTYFPSAADRDWLRLFMSALEDERSRFYRSYWLQQQQLHAGMRSQVMALWTGTYREAFGRFMRHTMPRQGLVLLSLPLGGEGRTLSVGQGDNFITVNLPPPGGDGREAMYVVAHEIVGSTSAAAVRDNASAADERSGETAKWITLAAVRGGAILLERVAPELLDGYHRYYLRVARADPGNDARAAFLATFPLPATIAGALERQIDGALGGI
ncbi:MAG: hypothetical protein ABIP66_14835 [Gemmatimonadaceae bacterium]